jgi:hypothetical protein
MNLNSPLFDSIRVKPDTARQESAATTMRCDSPGCAQPGEFRAPMGRLREGQYFCFCLDHVREYNSRYNYFNGMSDADVSKYLKDSVVGHRPTWSMGVRRGDPGFREEGAENGAAFADPLGQYRQRAHARPKRAAQPRYSPVTMRALDALGLDDTARAEDIKSRYKDLVKRHHPDANGGDRSCEEKLREIIHAYKTLRAARLV